MMEKKVGSASLTLTSMPYNLFNINIQNIQTSDVARTPRHLTTSLQDHQEIFKFINQRFLRRTVAGSSTRRAETLEAAKDIHGYISARIGFS